MDEIKTRDEMKQEAIKYLKKLGVFKPYINGFENEDKISFFEEFGGFWLYQEPEVAAKVKEFEETKGHLVYAVTHEYTSFGELWDFLYVSKYIEDGTDFVYPQGNGRFIVDAYVWNKDADWCSEFSSIGVISMGGGIKRVE